VQEVADGVGGEERRHSRLASGFVDRYLGRTIFSPVHSRPGAHGRFDDAAASTSVLAAVSRRRVPLAGAALAVALAARARLAR
jgi:hypothetical protein